MGPMGLFLTAYEIEGLPSPLACVAFRPSGPDGGAAGPPADLLSDMGVLSRRLGTPTALYGHPSLGQVVLALGPVGAQAQGGVHGREYATVGEVALDARVPEDRRTVVRLVHQGLRDYMSSRSDFFMVGQNAFANTRPAAEDGPWDLHRRLSFRVDYPGPLVLAVDIGQLAVRRASLSASPPAPGEVRGMAAMLSTPDGVWMGTVERVVEEVTAGDPVVVGPDGERETLVEHYLRTGQAATARAVDPRDHVVYLRRVLHGRAGREEPHAASLVRPLARPGEVPQFDPPPSARWRISQGMANQLGKARLGAHEVRVDVERPWRPPEQEVIPPPTEVLRDGSRLLPTEERLGRWDVERRAALKALALPAEAARLGPAVLAFQESVPRGAAATLYADVRYNLYRYLGTKADPRPARTLEFGAAAELGALLATVSPAPSAAVVAADDPVAAYASAKSALPGAAVQAVSSGAVASRPSQAGEEGGDAGYFNTVLWLATALEREAGRAPWRLDRPAGAEAHLGLGLLGRSPHLEEGGSATGLVTAVDARSGGSLHMGGVVPLPRGRFEGEHARAAVASALGRCAAVGGPPASVLVHREGVLSRAERGAIEAMLADLTASGAVAQGARIGFVEMSLDHPYRLLLEGQTGPATCRAGSLAVLDDRMALLATSGFPIKTRGTPEVLMLTARGAVAPADAARDVQLLGGLDWGGREVRWPITIWGPRAEMGVERARPWG